MKQCKKNFLRLYQIIIYIIIFSNLRLFALDPHKRITQYDIRVYTAKDGLPMNAMKDVLQDSRGYIWIATQEGLVRFDGVRFLLYDHSKYPDLKDNFIWDIEEDWNGNLWLATDGGGVSCFDGRKFTTYDNTDGLTSNVAMKICVSSDSSLWFATNRGINRWIDDKFIQYTEAKGLYSKAVETMFITTDNTVLITYVHTIVDSAESLFVIDSDSIISIPTPGFTISAMHELNSGEILLAEYWNRLFSFKKNKLSRYK